VSFFSPGGDDTELDIYCPHCDVVHVGCPVVMYSRYLGTGECPETELTFEIDLTEELV
jgi:hypothetical protein